MTISVNKPASPPSHTAFRISGALYGYATPPKLSYADDPGPPAKVSGMEAYSAKQNAISVGWSAPSVNAVYRPLPTVSSTSRTAFVFRHPGLSPGHHTLVVTDGKVGGVIGFGVSNAVHVRLNPFHP